MLAKGLPRLNKTPYPIYIYIYIYVFSGLYHLFAHGFLGIYYIYYIIYLDYCNYTATCTVHIYVCMA